MSGVTPDHPPASPGATKGMSNLAMRVVVALVLAPLTIGIAWVGGWPWLCLVAAAASLLYFEWLMVVGASGNRIAVSVAALGLAAAALAAPERRLWVAAGFVYAAAALFAAILVRRDADVGFVALIFVLLVVWGADIGGYFFGRGLGGPKLWPRVSPNKTWAGAIGGLALSLALAAGFAVSGFGRLLPLLLLGAALSAASQLGDLLESAVKRRFGVKDSSQIIPGHGGLLDRLDGFVAAIVVAALIGFMRGGLDGVGRGFMVW